jgi:hypothetical protein
MSQMTRMCCTARSTSLISKYIPLSRWFYSYKQSIREDKKFYKFQLTWVPHEGVAKKIPSWASNPKQIETFDHFMKSIQKSMIAREPRNLAKKVQQALNHLVELENKYPSPAPATSASGGGGQKGPSPSSPSKQNFK